MFTTCPYDSAHRVLRSRLQAHLVKCQKTHPVLSICPFNATHRLPETEMKVHTQECPDRIIMTEEKPPPKRHGAVVPPKPILQSDYLAETDPDYECWDD